LYAPSQKATTVTAHSFTKHAPAAFLWTASVITIRHDNAVECCRLFTLKMAWQRGFRPPISQKSHEEKKLPISVFFHHLLR